MLTFLHSLKTMTPSERGLALFGLLFFACAFTTLLIGAARFVTAFL